MADNEISGTENANGVPQLKPCPFCGGDPVAIETRPGRGELYCGNCDVVLGGNNAMTAEELTDAWNTRAERTCKMRRDEYGEWHCSECERGTDKLTGSDGIVEWCDSWAPNYCPDCGARVVE